MSGKGSHVYNSLFLAAVEKDRHGTNLPGKGLISGAEQGQKRLAPPRQPNSESAAGQVVGAPSRFPNECGDGQTRCAEKGQLFDVIPHSPHEDEWGNPGATQKSQPNSASPSSPSARQKAANRAAMATHAREMTILDTYKVMDGRLLKNIAWGEMPALEGASMRQGFVIRLLKRHGQVDDLSTPVGAVIKADTLQHIIQRAAEMQDAL